MLSISLKVKLVAILVTTANVVFIPKLPQFEIELSPEIVSSFPFSSFHNVSSLESCKPDKEQITGDVVALTSIPTTYITCSQDYSNSKNLTHWDMTKNSTEVIVAYGYPVEVHYVTTEDGYILEVQRIPRYGNTPVYLQHGLGGSSDSWLYMHRNYSLAFLLADAGYDVWLGNFRGTTYSLGHTTLQWDHPTNFSYWDFSWHENGIYDMPTIIDLIIEKTGKPKIFYVGATAYFIGLDLMPELNDKLLAGILLAPGGFLGRSTNPLRLLSALSTIKATDYLDPLFEGRIDGEEKVRRLLGISPIGNLCTTSASLCGACDDATFALFGFNVAQMNYTNIPNIISKFPNTMSVKAFYHYGQGANKCTFRQYDYGPEKNMRVYNSYTSPDYSFTNIKVKTYAFHGDFDNVFPPEDVQRTLDKLPPGTLVENIRVDDKYFNHADFVAAKDAQTLLYTKILSIMENILQP